MESPRYVVEPAPDDEVFVRTDETVWFNEVGTAPLADRILSLAWGRFAALEDGGPSSREATRRRRTPASTPSAR